MCLSQRNHNDQKKSKQKKNNLLGAEPKSPCSHRSPEKPGTLSTQDCPLKGTDIKPILPSKQLGIGGE